MLHIKVQVKLFCFSQLFYGVICLEEIHCRYDFNIVAMNSNQYTKNISSKRESVERR